MAKASGFSVSALTEREQRLDDRREDAAEDAAAAVGVGEEREHRQHEPDAERVRIREAAAPPVDVDPRLAGELHREDRLEDAHASAQRGSAEGARGNAIAIAQSVGSPTIAKSIRGKSPDFKRASIPPVPDISSSAVAATTKLKPKFSAV